MRVNGGIIGNYIKSHKINMDNQRGVFTLDQSLYSNGFRDYGNYIKLVGFAEFNHYGTTVLGSSTQNIYNLLPQDVVYWMTLDSYIGSTSTTTAATTLNNAFTGASSWNPSGSQIGGSGSVSASSGREIAFQNIRRNSTSTRAILSADFPASQIGLYRSYFITGYGIIPNAGNYSFGYPSTITTTTHKHSYLFVLRNVDTTRLSSYQIDYSSIGGTFTPYTRVLLGNSLQLSTGPSGPNYYITNTNFRDLDINTPSIATDKTIGIISTNYDVVGDFDFFGKTRGQYTSPTNMSINYLSRLNSDKFSSSGLTTYCIIDLPNDITLTTLVPGTSTYYPSNASLYVTNYNVIVPGL